MGSTGLEGRGTHAEIDAYCMKPFWTGEEGQGDHITFTDCRLVGFSHHWYIKRVNGVPAAIVLALIERNRARKHKTGAWGDDGAWYVREMSEYEGPYTHDCPLELLDIVPEPKDDGESTRWARDWRSRVRDYHATKKAVGVSLTIGTRFRLRDGLSIGGVDVGGTEGVVTGHIKRTAIATLDAYQRAVKITPKLVAEVLQ